MQENEFRNFLQNEGLTEKGVNSRISKAKRAENILGYSLDIAVEDDCMMYDSIMKIQPYEDPKHNPIQNTLRKYYIYKNSKEFPRLRDYKR